MSAAPRAYKLDGAVWWMREPEAQAVLDLTARLPGRVLVGTDTQAVAAWLACHLEGVEGIEGADGPLSCETWPVWQRVDLIDRALPTGAQLDLAQQIVAAASLTPAARADLKAALAVFWGGGCHCPGCAPPAPGKPSPPTAARAACLYTPAQRDALHTALMWGVALDAPDPRGSWWGWQAATLWRAARSEREAARRAAQEEQDRLDRKMRAAGLMR